MLEIEAGNGAPTPIYNTQSLTRYCTAVRYFTVAGDALRPGVSAVARFPYVGHRTTTTYQDTIIDIRTRHTSHWFVDATVSV